VVPGHLEWHVDGHLAGLAVDDVGDEAHSRRAVRVDHGRDIWDVIEHVGSGRLSDHTVKLYSRTVPGKGTQSIPWCWHVVQKRCGGILKVPHVVQRGAVSCSRRIASQNGAV
jgi:hypothetical protein